jgi:hypothetical protein
MLMQTFSFDTYQEMSDFISDKTNNHHFFVYINYINPETNTHILRISFLDKKINLFE